MGAQAFFGQAYRGLWEPCFIHMGVGLNCCSQIWGTLERGPYCRGAGVRSPSRSVLASCRFGRSTARRGTDGWEQELSAEDVDRGFHSTKTELDSKYVLSSGVSFIGFGPSLCALLVSRKSGPGLCKQVRKIVRNASTWVLTHHSLLRAVGIPTYNVLSPSSRTHAFPSWINQ